ncbi:hypothetical protein FXO37_05843 [Capsicum annuum]|nr:hypothetical protein FXO37_05843 [Capsicum annuum]
MYFVCFFVDDAVIDVVGGAGIVGTCGVVLLVDLALLELVVWCGLDDMVDPVWDVAILRDAMRELQKEVHDLHWELAAVREFGQRAADRVTTTTTMVNKKNMKLIMKYKMMIMNQKTMNKAAATMNNKYHEERENNNG